MSQQQARIETAVNGLISHLIPVHPDEDEETVQQRHDDCYSLVKQILESQSSPAISADVNHAHDLIRNRLRTTNASQALHFSNLYTRLLALPVLSQKWAILYMLYQLADSPDPNEPLPLTPLRQPSRRVPLPHLQKEGADRPKAPTPRREAAFKDAFAPTGLKKFPPEQAIRGPDDPMQIDGEEEAPPKRDVSLKSTLLADNQVEIEPSETNLLRDLPFTLQGLNSTTLEFSKETVLKLPTTLPPPLISLLHDLAEPSLLYRGLASFVNSKAEGLLGQSLRAAIGGELRSYLSLVATLESQIRRALSTLDQTAPRSGIGKAGVTLKRCLVWTREPTMGLRLLSVIAEESKTRHGGQLISLIHSFSSSHGDPTVAAFAERMLGHVTRPFYDILRHWIYDGELSDPYLEFFVKEQHPEDEKRKLAKSKGESSVWHDKYDVAESMIPTIMSRDFAQKLFLIGKSLNFIRHSCGDSQWVEDYSKSASKELRYGDTATLEAWIDEAYKTTMKRLMHLMTHKFHLFSHMSALKKYILLGQGDFIALLMESLAANLDRPAGAQYRHTLTAQLEHAIRGSNAQFESPEVLRRLDARMLQLSHGDIGWDCFTLEYKIDSPVDCVVTEWGNRQYLKVFNFLWRIKRLEFALASAWRKSTTGSRGVLATTDPSVLRIWKLTRGTLAEMIHFTGQLQYYILFEVIETSWDALQREITSEDCTLDGLITAHRTYLENITQKGLLGSRRRQHDDAIAKARALGIEQVEDRNGYMFQLSALFKTMLAYRDSVDGLYSWAVSDFTLRQEADVRATRSTAPERGSKRPNLSVDMDDPFANSSVGAGGVESELPALQERLQALGDKFRTRLASLLGDLAYQSDADMRFLGVAMNFNDVYQLRSQKRSKGGPSTATATRTGEAPASATAGGSKGKEAAG